ncbi:sigma-70 family RNA polymerase sigma factor [soil metagenome]
MTEQELIQGCKANNPQAQRELFQRFNSRMMAVCVRYMDDRARAQDVLQEGFIKVFSHISSFKSEGSLEGWIRRIMVTTALKALRTHQELRLDDQSGDFEVHPDFDYALDKISEKELLKLIAQLPAGYRTVFNLYVLEGYAHQEIASALQIAESTSRSQLLKARLQLQKSIIAAQQMAEKTLLKGR